MKSRATKWIITSLIALFSTQGWASSQAMEIVDVFEKKVNNRCVWGVCYFEVIDLSCEQVNDDANDEANDDVSTLCTAKDGFNDNQAFTFFGAEAETVLAILSQLGEAQVSKLACTEFPVELPSPRSPERNGASCDVVTFRGTETTL